MTRLVLTPDLDSRIARTVALPAVVRLTERVRSEAQTNAPDAAVWISARDERVRPSHVEADGQVVPDNLRYAVPAVSGGGVDMARAPRDPDLPAANREGCRCFSGSLPGVVAASIMSTAPVVAGFRVSAEVESRFPRVVESEFPSSPDTGGGWMARAVNTVAAQVRAGQARGT